jgi:uncharacterized protein (UPF0332 family)
MNPRDNLDLADELCDGIREVDWRAATSRAYYAAFHVARVFLRQLGFEVPRGDQAHAYLWLRLSNSGHPDTSTAGADLNELRKTRNWADYDLDQSFEHPVAFGQVRIALKTVELLEIAATMPTILRTITDTIKLYERDVLGHVTWRP